jgi:Outer membrane protein beta-barrel domain
MAGQESNRLASSTDQAEAPARGLRHGAIGQWDRASRASRHDRRGQSWSVPRGGRVHVASLRILGLVIATTVVLGLPGTARAQGLYVGGGVGATDIVVPVLGGSWDYTATYKLFLGYELPKIVGFEGAWVNLGGHENEWLNNATGTLHTDGWTAALTGRIPIVSWFALYGKVGYFFWNTRFDVDWSWGEPTPDRSNNGEDLFWGVGVRFNSGKFSFLGEVERYSSGEYVGHTAFVLALRYTF